MYKIKKHKHMHNSKNNVNTQLATESVWWIQNRVYAVLPEEALSISSKAIPGKKIHHVQLHAKSTCYQLASFPGSHTRAWERG